MLLILVSRDVFSWAVSFRASRCEGCRMRLAVQEGLLPGRSLAERLVAAEELGFEGVELWGRGLLDRLSEVRDAFSTVRVGVSTICSGYRGDLLSPERGERELAMCDIARLLEAAAELGAVGVIVVPTFGGPKLPDLSPLYRDVREVERSLLVEELRILGRRAEDVGAHVLLEPLNRYVTHLVNTLSQALEVVEEASSPGVVVMADFLPHEHRGG